ncbi:hypothetical protein [Mycoplasma phocoenae]|uniref:Uncharacterized protein n=1 Tax=Mycoplasma phocoenae TaxID=754517 RepID=A0A858U7A7_9MOLU|nr:hypothetical protein [Mycoplasma phocoenae]QJG67113.1 hypothetical protein HGG69_02200 [Mycoplasma phocoenae]
MESTNRRNDNNKRGSFNKSFRPNRNNSFNSQKRKFNDNGEKWLSFTDLKEMIFDLTKRVETLEKLIK